METNLDPPRRRLLELMAAKQIDKATLSLEVLGRNHAYIHQYLTKGTPREMHERERELLAQCFDVDPDEFRSGPARRTGKSEFARIYEAVPANRRREFIETIRPIADLFSRRG